MGLQKLIMQTEMLSQAPLSVPDEDEMQREEPHHAVQKQVQPIDVQHSASHQTIPFASSHAAIDL